VYSSQPNDFFRRERGIIFAAAGARKALAGQGRAGQGDSPDNRRYMKSRTIMPSTSRLPSLSTLTAMVTSTETMHSA